ncbi:MAG TPA: hypothetical protein VGB62_03655 [Allosphingosinicella sp.]|jgi:hypothetical protein
MSRRLLIAGGALAAAAAGGAGMAIASDGKLPRPDAVYVPLDDVVVPIVGTRRVEGTLRVRLVVEADDESAAAALEKRMPELRAASLGAAVEFSRLYGSPLAAVDAERLRGDMNAALAAAGVPQDRVLVTEVGAFPL